MKNINTIFFDIDNTLLNYTRAEEKGIFVIKEKYFPTVDQQYFIKTWQEEAKRFWQMFEQKQLSFQDQRIKRVQAIWQQLGKTITEAEGEQLFMEYLFAYEQSWEAFPSVVETLASLKQQGIKIGIL